MREAGLSVATLTTLVKLQQSTRWQQALYSNRSEAGQSYIYTGNSVQHHHTQGNIMLYLSLGVFAGYFITRSYPHAHSTIPARQSFIIATITNSTWLFCMKLVHKPPSSRGPPRPQSKEEALKLSIQSRAHTEPRVQLECLFCQIARRNTCSSLVLTQSTPWWPSREHGLLHESSLFWLPHYDVQILHCLPSSAFEQVIQDCNSNVNSDMTQHGSHRGGLIVSSNSQQDTESKHFSDIRLHCSDHNRHYKQSDNQTTWHPGECLRPASAQKAKRHWSTTAGVAPLWHVTDRQSLTSTVGQSHNGSVMTGTALISFSLFHCHSQGDSY